MRLIYAALILLLMLMTSAQCQQTAEDWLNKGLSLNGQGKYDEAIRLNPNLDEAWSNKGGALYLWGKCDEAIKACDEAIRLNPNNVAAQNNKGMALKSLGHTKEANAGFAKAKELGYAG